MSNDLKSNFTHLHIRTGYPFLQSINIVDMRQS